MSERPVTRLELPVQFAGPDGAGFSFDLNNGRPVVRAFDTSGAQWFELGPSCLDPTPHPDAEITVLPAFRIFNPKTGKVVVETGVMDTESGGGGFITLHRQDGHTCVMLDASIRGGSISIHSPVPQDQGPGFEEIAIEMHCGADGGEILLCPRDPGLPMKLGFGD